MEMSDKIEKIQRFLSVCDELVEGSYMVAEGKISEALKEIAGCRELTNLFAAVTDGYDYPAAKRAYLRPRTGVGASGRVGAYLPSERQDILAFVFCLFVEIDAGTIYLNDLLLRYFYVDGSYTASYAVFAGRMIKPFRDIVRECFPECGKRGQVAIQRKKREEALSAFAQSLPVERNRVMSRDLREEEKTAGEEIFTELSAAAARRDIAEVRALLAGYRYFLRYIGAEGEESAALFALAQEL
ncbi:MAG TPA: hypothetical protein H9683_01265 [Firmicutes bacterium]|nr:hypothetical protein [Bacillota bacterium]